MTAPRSHLPAAPARSDVRAKNSARPEVTGHHRRGSTPLVVLLSVLALSACGADGGAASGPDDAAPPSASTASESATTPGPSSSPATTIPEAWAFTATTVDGQNFDAAELAGTDTVLWFWAPWCPVCARSADEVNAVAAANPTLQVVGVSGLSSDVTAMQDFVTRNEVGSLTHLADTDGSLYARFEIPQQHTYAFVDSAGDVTVVPGASAPLEDLVAQAFGPSNKDE